VVALVACLSLLPLGSAVQPSLAAGNQPARGPVAAATAAERSKPAYEATIRVTKHGIPHITADDFGSLGYGGGYAAASASICTLADTLVTARGQRSRWFGPSARYDDQVTLEASNLQVDAFVTDLHNRRVVEKLLTSDAGPGRQAREMVRGYVAGINKWLRSNQVTDPGCKGDGYLKPDATELDLWYGVYLANLLASGGVFLKEIVTASPPSLTDPGLPEIPVKAADVDREALLKALGRDPSAPFGSNATAIGGASSSTGRGMLLGNPHFPWRGRYHFTQQHLTIPGRYNVAGASLIGSPAINIGWNENVAWSHTVSTAYRFTPYEYTTVGPGTSYLTPSGLKQAERRVVKIQVRRPDGSIGTVTEDLYRTPQGYVIDAPTQLMSWSPVSFWAIRDANAEQLRTVDSFLNMGKATDVRDLLRRQDAGGGIPWVNTTAADSKGNALYADHSVVPNVPDALANSCMTVVGRVINQAAGLPGLNGNLAESTCAWGTDADAQRPGILGPRNLPDVVRRDWVMNANDSFWLPHPETRLEGFANIIGCERCARTMRTKMVMQYVIDRLASGKKETPASLRQHQHANRLRAAEVMRQDGDLDEVCRATGETRACAVLEKWDGRSRRTSVGTHIFEEFVERLPDNPWRVAFSAADPLHTPRGLDTANQAVVGAMAEGIASLRRRKVPFDAPWGSLQVAGDRGAPPIGLGGGTGDASGNANALASRKPVANVGKYRPITYGSSHIQAIAFEEDGRVNARTILTYGQSEDPTSRWSSDQTRLFGAGRWVRFAWTPAEIAEDLVQVIELRS
jgi:acyl-homoserine-lactone acylase